MDGRWYRARLEKVIRCRIVRVSQRFSLPIQPHPLKPFYVKDAAGNVCGFWKLHGSFSTQAEKAVLQGGNITFLLSSNVNLLQTLCTYSSSVSEASCNRTASHTDGN